MYSSIKYDVLKDIIDKFTKEGITVSTMESCTGGGIANCITNIEGASNVFHYGAVTYTNEFKIRMGVDSRIIDKFGVYSLETAKAMAKAITKFSGSTIGIGISGNLNAEDPIENKGAIIYFSIYETKTKKFYSKVLSVHKPKREETKVSIINIIIETLRNIYFN